CQCPSCMFAVIFTAVALYFLLGRPPPVAPIGHAGSADRVSNQDGPLRPFGCQKHFYYRGSNVDTIGNDVRSEHVIGEDCAQDPGFAMVECAHGIEGVRSMVRSGGNAVGSFLVGSIGMSDTGNPAPV